MRPGVGGLVGGLILAAVAGAVSWASYDSADPGDGYVVWWGGVVAGGLIAISGGIRYASFLHEAQTQKDTRGSTLVMRSIMYGSAYVAAADGKITDDEIATIGFIVERLTGQAVDSKDLYSTVEGSADSGFGSSDQFTGRLFLLGESDKVLVLRCAVMTAMADGDLGDKERKRLGELSRQLRAPQGVLEALLIREQSSAPTR